MANSKQDLFSILEKDTSTAHKEALLVSPICVFHARFPTLYPAVASKHWNTYHRGIYKLLENTPIEAARFIGNQLVGHSDMYLKTGTYYNPYHFAHYKERINLTTEKIHIKHPSSAMYNRLLTYQKQAARYVVEQFNKREYSNVWVNADYDYTCVLIKVDKPQEITNTKDWTNFLSLFLMPLMNALAMEQGINIEILRRASFGFLRPAIAECGSSIRINLGLCPQEYLNILIDALDYMAKLETTLTIFQKPLHNRYSNNVNLDSKKRPISENQAALWTNLWETNESTNASFINYLFSKGNEHVVEHLTDLILIECCEQPIKALFNNQYNLQRVFADPFINIVQNYILKNKMVDANAAPIKHKSFQWTHNSTIKDSSFWLLFRDFAATLGAHNKDINEFMTSATTDGLYCFLDSLTQKFYFNPSLTSDSSQDGYGSDSECDEHIEPDNKETTLSAKKLITATGMRAIQLAYAVAKLYLAEKHQIHPAKCAAINRYMYYETGDAIQDYSIPISISSEHATCGYETGITFFDNNFCNSEHQPTKKLLTEISTRDYICILDVTSATTDEMNVLLTDIFSIENIEVCLFVSSGLKNEQSMSDLNPYGTVRIFARDKEECDYIYGKLTALEDKALYAHPKESHLLRLQAKNHGMTPTNKRILQQHIADKDELSSNTLTL